MAFENLSTNDYSQSQQELMDAVADIIEAAYRLPEATVNGAIDRQLLERAHEAYDTLCTVVVDDAVGGRPLAQLPALSPAGKAMPKPYWAVQTISGAHIGLWDFEADAVAVSREYEGSFVVPMMTTDPTVDLENPALRDVRAERRRQISSEGRLTSHDDRQVKGQLARAAAAYAYFGSLAEEERACVDDRTSHVYWLIRQLLPLWGTACGGWDICWWKPTNRRRDMVKAAALLLAEIERLDRAALKAEAR